jgi:hypothetical protein
MEDRGLQHGVPHSRRLAGSPATWDGKKPPDLAVRHPPGSDPQSSAHMTGMESTAKVSTDFEAFTDVVLKPSSSMSSVTTPRAL